jgi:hypothetical protein
MALVGIINIKEIDNFKPFLKIGSADKDQKDAFAYSMVRQMRTNIAIRRIYSSKSDHFLVQIHFDGKKRIPVRASQKSGDSRFTVHENY